MKKPDCFAYLPGGGCRVLNLQDTCPMTSGKACSFYQTKKQLIERQRNAQKRLAEIKKGNDQ